MRCSDERRCGGTGGSTHPHGRTGLGKVKEAKLAGPHSDEDSFRGGNRTVPLLLGLGITRGDRGSLRKSQSETGILDIPGANPTTQGRQPHLQITQASLVCTRCYSSFKALSYFYIWLFYSSHIV